MATVHSQAAAGGHTRRGMTWAWFVAGAVLSWGVYGAMLARGQMQLGNPMKALLCVGLAYFLVGVLVPVAALMGQGGVNNFNGSGAINATIGGILGAVGAICIIWAFKSGGSPLYVMPLVFGGAPIINVIWAMAIQPPKAAPSPMWYLGLLFASLGAGMVLYFRPPA
jgi:hypothetical protein